MTRPAQEQLQPQPIRVALAFPAGTDLDTSREEISLAEFPITTMAQRRPGVTEASFEEFFGLDEQGAPIYRKWTIVGSEKYGLPIAGDEDIYVALMKMLEQHDFNERVIACTRYQICQFLRLEPDGKLYRRIADAFYRFRHTSFVAQNVFRDPANGALIRHETFGIIDSFKFVDRIPRARRQPAKQAELPLSYFRVGDEFLRRLRDGKLKRLDLQFWRQLSTYLTNRLYRFLDKNRYRKTHYEIGLTKLAQRIGLSATHPEKELKRLLRRPLEELRSKEFLLSHAYLKAREGWKVQIAFNPAYEPYRSRRPEAPPPAPDTPSLPLEPSTAPDEAPDLVRRFHELAHGAAPKVVSKSELAKAQKLLDLQGSYELARYTVDFACAQARATGFAVQNFGAVFSNNYPDRARAEHEAERARAEHQRAYLEDARLHNEYDQWFDERLDQRWQAMGPEVQEAAIKAADDELQGRLGAKALHLMTAKARRGTAERLARGKLGNGLPSFEEWHQTRQTTLRSPTLTRPKTLHRPYTA